MAQTTHLASFGPVFVIAGFPELPRVVVVVVVGVVVVVVLLPLLLLVLLLCRRRVWLKSVDELATDDANKQSHVTC